jgi:endoglucanase
MRLPSSLFSFMLLLSLVPACGAAGSGDSALGSATGGAAANAGNKGWQDDIDGAVGTGGRAGYVGVGGSRATGAGGSASATWNSAKTPTLNDAQLQAEYDSWKNMHAEVCQDGSWVVVKDGAVVSEGIGYGMLLAAALTDRVLFDGLWKYYQNHADTNGLMNWSTSKCEASGNNHANAATDADLDTTMALVQGAARWPSGGYLAKAKTLAAKIVQFESDLCDGRRVLRPGDAFGGCTDPSDTRINPSYFAPGYYQVFAHYFTDQAATWTALRDGSYQLHAIYQARLGNLVPDWSGPDGSNAGSEYDGYGYDACRTPWRVAVDYAWTGDTRAKTFMQNIASWVDAGGGLPKAAQHQNSAFVGAFALAGGYEQGKFDDYMSGWLGAQLADTPYFQGTLRVLYLLVATGKFSSTL